MAESSCPWRGSCRRPHPSRERTDDSGSSRGGRRRRKFAGIRVRGHHRNRTGAGRQYQMGPQPELARAMLAPMVNFVKGGREDSHPPGVHFSAPCARMGR